MIKSFIEFLKITDGIAASDIINWFLAFSGGVVVFRIIDNMQTTMERHSLIKDLEDSINNMLSSDIARSNVARDNQGDAVTVRAILHDAVPWEPYEKDKTDVRIINSQRYIRIRNKQSYQDYISTQMLHETLIYFRRIEKLYKDHIIKPVDLADLWRELLPFANSGRLEFYESYFGPDDIKSMNYVLIHTLLACNKHKINCALKYFKNYYKANENVQAYYNVNNRFKIRDCFKLCKFKILMKR